MDASNLYGVEFKEVLKYTDNLSPQNYIGCSKFAKIYHGVIDRGARRFQDVIVKIWDTSSCVFRDNQLRLMREVIFLWHENVQNQPAAVKLLGYVCNDQHITAIYALRALNTLCNQLNQDDFNWVRRIKVALWFARMVKFFHCKKPPYGPLVIHNIDARHILLDEDYVPKLFNFDLMTGGGPFPQDETEEEQGEYNDVFAFGLLLLSLISKRFISKEEAMESLIPLDSNSKSGGSLFECESHFYTCDGEEVSKLAMQCMSSEHPSMKQVVGRLQKLQVVRNHGDLIQVKPKLAKYRSYSSI